MADRRNPRKLNALQLRTLALLQELARHPETSTPQADGSVTITMLPQPHGNHVHVGHRVASVKNASGLWNEKVWNALARKGMAEGMYPVAITLTAEGLAYDTGAAAGILIGSDH